MKKTTCYFIVSVGILIFGGCSKSHDSLPTIDGYTSSNEVAKSNLVAYWTFDGTDKEAVSGTASVHAYGTVGYTTGVLGQALQLTKGVLVYPTIAALNNANALNNFTVSMWVNTVNQKGVAGGGFQGFFANCPSGVTDIWPDIFVGAETSRNTPSSDTLQFKGLFNLHPLGGGNSLQDNVAQVNGTDGGWFYGAKKWSHLTVRWNATTHQLQVFGNGVSYGAWNDRGTTGIEIMSPPLQVIFGSLPSADIGFAGAPAQQSWNPWATASIDDVRVFNTALADKDIVALYHLGVAGK